MRYDDICTPTDEIYMRVAFYENGMRYETLKKTSGFKIMFCGREIGVHQWGMKWRATDMRTGLNVSLHDYITRGHLIKGLLDKTDMYMKTFADCEALADKEAEFQVLRRKS